MKRGESGEALFQAVWRLVYGAVAVERVRSNRIVPDRAEIDAVRFRHK